MEYRELGRTGIKVSVIALGCEGFVANEGALTEQLLNAAEQGGINCIDLYAPQPEMRSRLGKWLRGRRGKFVLQAHLCTVWQEGQYKRTREIGEVKASFERSAYTAGNGLYRYWDDPLCGLSGRLGSGSWWPGNGVCKRNAGSGKNQIYRLEQP